MHMRSKAVSFHSVTAIHSVHSPYLPFGYRTPPENHLNKNNIVVHSASNLEGVYFMARVFFVEDEHILANELKDFLEGEKEYVKRFLADENIGGGVSFCKSS